MRPPVFCNFISYNEYIIKTKFLIVYFFSSALNSSASIASLFSFSITSSPLIINFLIFFLFSHCKTSSGCFVIHLITSLISTFSVDIVSIYDNKKTIYGFTVNDLFIANIQFISFCFHNLVTHGKYHPHIQHHFLFCIA